MAIFLKAWSFIAAAEAAASMHAGIDIRMVYTFAVRLANAASQVSPKGYTYTWTINDYLA